MLKHLKPNSATPYILVILGGLLSGFGVGTQNINPEMLSKFLNEAAQNQITQAGFFFTLAAWIHSGRVKKEIKLNFESLTTAIDKVADAFREDLRRHSDIITNLSIRVEKLETKAEEK